MINKTDVEKANALLDLKRKIVGIKIVTSKNDFDQIQAKELTYPLAYCVAVKHATNGIALKMTKEFSGCGGSTRALGLAPPTDSFYSGQEGCALGLYENPKIAADVAGQMKFYLPGTYGVIIKPLEQFETDPDVVLMVGDSYQIMRVIQGYSYVFGMQPNFNMLGNQAVCVECTTYPLLTNKINVSMFCSGTRFLAKWQKTEVAVGIPFEKFGQVIEGVLLTANAVEMIDRKQVIQARLANLGNEGAKIDFDEPYYLKLERQKKMQRKGG